jgi:hypothetical protein
MPVWPNRLPMAVPSRTALAAISGILPFGGNPEKVESF